MNANGSDALKVIEDKILAGLPVKFQAFDADQQERESSALKNFMQQYRGSVSTCVYPHPTKPGCKIVVNVNSIANVHRKGFVQWLSESPLEFELVPANP